MKSKINNFLEYLPFLINKKLSFFLTQIGELEDLFYDTEFGLLAQFPNWEGAIHKSEISSKVVKYGFLMDAEKNFVFAFTQVHITSWIT